MFMVENLMLYQLAFLPSPFDVDRASVPALTTLTQCWCREQGQRLLSVTEQ